MARRDKLTDFQRALSARLAEAANRQAAPSNRLGVTTGQRQWLLRLDQAGEVLFPPEIYEVPLTASWFRGVANVRGHLVSVVDWSEFCGGTPAALNYRSRVVLLPERMNVPAGLLVGTVSGLRNLDTLERVSDTDGTARWTVAMWRDADGRIWEEVDLAQMVEDASFLRVEAA
jgi:twitching motility protein PilI